MLAYRVIACATVVAVSSSLSGCIQLGEYGMGFTCGSFSDDVVALIQRDLEVTVEVANFWAGESDVWCSFDLVIPEGHEAAEVGTRIEGQVRSRIAEMSSGVEVRIVDSTGIEWIITDVTSSTTR